MATQKKQRDKGALKDVRASAHKIWLAGLGAVSMAEEEGSRVFRQLVDRGENLEAAGKKKASSIRKQAGEAWTSLEGGFEARVAGVLKRLGVPSAADLREVQRRLDRLEKRSTGGRRAAASKKKKTTTRKKAATKS